jgi:hypothetical protein
MPSPVECLEHARHLLAERSVTESLCSFGEAERAGADADACAAGRWECAMLLGQYEAAWQASDEIGVREQATGSQRFWDGTPLAGKRVMLRCLNGFGDALQFIRYAPKIRGQAASLCVEAHPEIVSLLRACAGVEHAITWGQHAPAEPPPWDAQIEIMELPRIFRATSATVPVVFPYLDPKCLPGTPSTTVLIRTMQGRRREGRLQVGVAWRSSNWNPLRSLPLPSLATALETLEHCDFYSLQEDGARELAHISNPNISNVETVFTDLALRISQLDLVLTIDGVLAHLAGALGIPVLLLLPYAADWRWGLEARTPWYPRATLFRQQSPGDWSYPVHGAVTALRHLTGA